MPDEARPNPFQLLHKALRYGHCHILSQLGAQDFGDDAAGARLLTRLVKQLELYRVVAEARQEALLSTLRERGQELAAATCEDHAAHLTALAELGSLVRAVNVAAPQRRRLAGRSVYRCFALYVSADMERMDEDETLLLTALHQMLADDELRLVEGRSLGCLDPRHFRQLSALLLPALSTAELETLLPLLQRHMEPSHYAEAVERAMRPLLGTGSPAAA
jgi:hypothetical protein